MTEPGDDSGAGPTEPNSGAEGTLDAATAADHDAIASTRASRAWLGVLPALVVLAVIVTFVFQNTQSVTVRFLAFSGTFALSAALLSAAALGIILTVALGSIRIAQLRRELRRRRSRHHRREREPR